MVMRMDDGSRGAGHNRDGGREELTCCEFVCSVWARRRVSVARRQFKDLMFRRVQMLVTDLSGDHRLVNRHGFFRGG